jgi:integrase
MVKLPWIPAEQQWLDVLGVFRAEPVRNPLMLALAYDAPLRREELCSLRTDDVDPGQRMLRIRAETTKTRRGRAVPYSAATGVLLAEYLVHRARLSGARGGCGGTGSPSCCRPGRVTSTGRTRPDGTAATSTTCSYVVPRQVDAWHLAQVVLGGVNCKRPGEGARRIGTEVDPG